MGRAWHSPLEKIAARHGRRPILGWAVLGTTWHGHVKPFIVPGPLPDDSPESLTPLYHSLFSSFPSPPHPVSHASLFRLLYDSLSLSTWKITGFSTWSLRINPSSGNLHPIEAHLLSPPLPDCDSPFSSSSFLAHYSPKDHSLELHADLDLSSLFPDHGGSVLLLALSSIYWHEAWKYGERALRYCNHDVGHAFAAASLGWDARLLDGLGHDDLDLLLGLHRANPLPPSHPSSPSAPFAPASPGSSPSIRTAPSSSSSSASRSYGSARPSRRAEFSELDTARFNGPCRYGSVL